MLRTVRTEGPALAVRRTAPTGRGARVHLVGTAAGPLGGDVLVVRLAVGPGATLEVAGVAAAVVLPGPTEPCAQLLLEVDVAPGGLLVSALPPVVVTGRAALAQTTRVRLAGDGQVHLVEQVRLGRHDEPGGWWSGRTDVTRDGVPLLRQTTTLGDDPEDGLRVLRSELDSTPRPVAPAAAGGALAGGASDRTVVLDLAGGGTLTVTVG